jgi:hypothetical protein
MYHKKVRLHNTTRSPLGKEEQPTPTSMRSLLEK